MELTSDKLILDLCGGTGAWSQPYRDAGYFVDVWTWPFRDVLSFSLPLYPVYGVLAAPPCTEFTKASAWKWKESDTNGRTLINMAVVISCLRIIAMVKPHFWALENPPGRLRRWLGDPQYTFDPCDFGDHYTKKTYLWGRFNKPREYHVPVLKRKYIQNMGQSKDRSMKRSITPSGFAHAFFTANQ